MTTYTWLGSESQSYSRVSTCLALSASVYAQDSETCLRLLNKQLKYLHHGVVDLLYATNSPRKYLIAFKPSANEVYVAFCGTENLKALLPSLKVFGMPNHFQGRFHGGFKDQADQIPLEPFYYFLDKYSDIKLIFTGHSLGGAIAAVVTTNMLVDGQTDERRNRISCVAFGAPVLCDQECSIYLNNRYKNQFQFYINQSDVVPYIFCLLHNFATNLLEQNEDVVNNIQNCENWIKTLLQLEAIHTLDDKYEWFTFLNWFKSPTDSLPAMSALKAATYSLSKCLGVLKKLVPKYQPFGQCYCTKTDIIVRDSPNNVQFHVERLNSDDLADPWKLLKVTELLDSCVTHIQDHFILSYIREIHENVIVKQKLVQSAAASHVKIVLSNHQSPLTFFLPPSVHKWLWAGSSECNQFIKTDDSNSTIYTWSAISCDYEDGFMEISLRLRGSAVSLISELHYEHHRASEMFSSTAKLQDTNDGCVRLFLLQTYKDRLPWLKYVIISHFGAVDLSAVFETKRFISTIGLAGRKRQISELSLLDLYKHALSYCLFTSPSPYNNQTFSVSDTAEDNIRRDEIKRNLLLCEDSQKNIIQLIEKTWYKSNPKMIRRLKELILDGKTEMSRFDKSAENSDKLPTLQPSSPSLEQELDASPVQTISVSKILSRWDTTVVESTEIISQAVPILFAMYLSMTATFQMEAMNALRSKDWTKTEAVFVIGTTVAVAFTGVGIMYPIWVACMAALVVGIGTSTIFYHYFSTMRQEYVEMLLFIAKSIGLSTSQIRAHPFILEKEISEMYRERIYTFSNDDYIINNWKQYFPESDLIPSQEKSVIPYWLNLVKCVDANYQLRKLLSQDVAVGIVGGGKIGKSQLLARMFGLPTQPDLNVRTEKMTSYRITNEFRVVDFPHMNSSIDALKRCFSCHHTMVNAIIVVLNGEQRGDDVKIEGHVIETVKKLAVGLDGIDILFCFNRCDRLARCPPRMKSQGIKKREKPSPESTTSNDAQRLVYWTKEDTERNKIEFATRAYALKPENCMMTFFALDNDDDPNWWQIHDSLKEIGLSTYDDIKTTWLRDVLEKNGLDQKSIEKILNFEYQQE